MMLHFCETTGALSSVQLAEFYNMSQNIMTMARIWHFDDLHHCAYFFTTYSSLAINMLYLENVKIQLFIHYTISSNVRY